MHTLYVFIGLLFLKILFKSAKSDLFRKNLLPDFLCNKFLIKMYRLLQKYTF